MGSVFLQNVVMKKSELYEKVGLNLKTKRLQLKMKQADVADSAGISRPSLANIEGGRQALTLHLFFQLAAVLKVENAASLLPQGVLNESHESSDQQVVINTTGNLSKKQEEMIQQLIGGSGREIK